MSSFLTPHTAAPRRRRRLLPALSLGVAGLFLATACASGQEDAEQPHDDTASASQAAAPERAAVGEGQGEPDALAGVTFSEGEDGTPSVELDGEIATDQPTTRVLTAGEGEQVAEGDVLKMSLVAVDPASGEVLGENFTAAPESVPVDEQLKAMNPEMHGLLVRNGVGSVVAVYNPAQEVPAPPAEGASPSASPSTQTQPAQLYVYRVEGIVPARAEGEDVAERDDRLPEVTEDEAGTPQIGDAEGEAPADMVVQPLIRGEGPEVGADDQVTVQYVGETWSEGTLFDSSWDRGEPATFSLNGVIPGWKEGLAGQTVGSRVLLSIPAEKAYGEQGSPPDIGPDEPLLFVVDVLDAQAPSAPPAN